MRKIAIMLIVLMVVGIGFLSGCSTEENKLQITSFRVAKGVGEGSGNNIYMPYTATVKIANYGSNEVSNAELTVTLYKNNNQAGSKIEQLGNIEKGWELTEQVVVSDGHFTVGATYKVVAILMLGSKVLDTKEMIL